MKTHYSIFSTNDDDYIDRTMCGLYVNEEPNESNNWKEVDCKRCLKNKNKFEKIKNETNKIELQQMESFVNFMENKN